MLHAVTPPLGVSVLISNTDHDQLTADLRAAEADLDTAQETHRAIPARLPLGQVAPGQQVLDIQTKLITHAIRIAAFNTATTLTRDIRVHTSYARANDEAHALIRQALTGSGDIGPFPVWWTHGLAARINREKKEWVRHAVALPKSIKQKRLPLSWMTIGR
jgi:hypothetical protein